MEDPKPIGGGEEQDKSQGGPRGGSQGVTWSVARKPAWGPPSAEARAAARKALLITDEQISRCAEVRQYIELSARLSAPGKLAEGAEGEEEERGAMEKAYRLAVKRRLNKAGLHVHITCDS